MGSYKDIDLFFNLSDCAMDFLENSKNDSYDFSKSPNSVSVTKMYQARQSTLPVLDNNLRIPLPPDPETTTDALHELNRRRASTREYSKQGLSFEAFSKLVGRSYFPTGTEPAKFNIPSGGALYPIDLYFINLHVQGLDKGVYYYNPGESCFQLFSALSEEETKDLMSKGFMVEGRDDIDFTNAAAIVLFGAMSGRSTIKYHDRGLRFTFFDIGSILQSLYLNAAALNIGFCANGGFVDDILRNLLEFRNPTENVLLTAVIGSMRNEE